MHACWVTIPLGTAGKLYIKDLLNTLIFTSLQEFVSLCSGVRLHHIYSDLGAGLSTLSRLNYFIPTSLPSALSVKGSTLSSYPLIMFPLLGSNRCKYLIYKQLKSFPRPPVRRIKLPLFIE